MMPSQDPPAAPPLPLPAPQKGRRNPAAVVLIILGLVGILSLAGIIVGVVFFRQSYSA